MALDGMIVESEMRVCGDVYLVVYDLIDQIVGVENMILNDALAESDGACAFG